MNYHNTQQLRTSVNYIEQSPLRYGFYHPKTKTFFQFSNSNQYQTVMETLRDYKQSQKSSNDDAKTNIHTQDFSDFDHILVQIQQQVKSQKYQQQMMFIQEF